jgi:CMP-N,N'-diacetyllegionaminic acid synthase
VTSSPAQRGSKPDPASTVALIPARSGSERVPGKNIAPLAGHPLLAYSIVAARESGCFGAVVVSTDSPEIAEVAASYGGELVALRPREISTTTSPDIEWVLHSMQGRDEDAFAILRPTSPFRGAATVVEAMRRFRELGDRIDSLRAVERCRQHPAKMWVLEDELMSPLLPQPAGETPLHSRQYQTLPPVYVQTSSLEIAWRRVLEASPPTISGARVAPFFTEGWEGFSIDYPEDLARAEAALERGEARLPALPAAAGRLEGAAQG